MTMMKNKILKYLKSAGTALCLAGAALATLASCNSVIYDYEGDCSVTYRLKFRYDRNLKWADAFASEVRSVRIYAFDNDGTLVREFAESGSRLATDNYEMTLDLPAGNYHLVAWCGIDNEGVQPQFDVLPTTKLGSTRLGSLSCRLRRESHELYPAKSDRRLEFMFHGELDVELPDDENGGDYTYTMPLTKNTNHIRVILQHLSGEDLDVSKFGFRIEEANGHYAHNNTLLEDETITYLPYAKLSGEAGVVLTGENTRSDVVTVKTAIADLSTVRMMADRTQNMMLTITDDEGTDVARIPLIDYALLTKDYYEDAYGRRMTNQEFLDREDDFTLTLFLDKGQRWIVARVYINSWRVVQNDYDM